MALNGFVRTFKPLEILTEEQIEAIHRAVLDVLENTGVKMQHPEALKLFEANGAKVDFESEHVWIPPALVEDSLRRAPSSFRMRARDPENDLIVGGNTVYFATFPGMKSLDLQTWEQRNVTREEYYETLTILDALENLHFLSNYCPYFGFEGISPVMAIPESVAAKLRNSTKCVATGSQNDSELFSIRMAEELGTDILGQCSCSSPLVFYKAAIESAFRTINSGNPVHIISGLVMGGTGPATIAGSTVLSTAELAAGVTLTQLIRPGARVLVTDFVMPQDMRTGAPAFGSIGNSLHQVIFGQIWRRYGIPTKSSVPGPTNSKKIDFQAGYEKALGAMTAALSGIHMIFLTGCVYGELTFHPIQAILDDDVAGMIGRFIEGVQVTPETLALELIGQVGPIPGFYLDKQHTRDWWMKEQFLPKAADTLTYPEWLQSGKKDCIQYAEERKEEILSSHRISIALTDEQDNAISRILEEARDFYGGKGLI